MKKIVLIFIFLISFLYASKPELSVSILPQKYFVEKIVKDKYEINVMVKPGASPHTYEPKSSQMKSLVASKVYFYTGVSFEQAWLDKFKQNAQNTLFVDATNGIDKMQMVEDEHHHEEEGHDHSGLDPHVWLDPILVKTQAKNIYETMIKIDSSNADFYKKNYEEFLKELDVLNENIKIILNPYKEKPFMVFHPSWGYFAKRYNLEEISIEIEGKEPKPSELVQLIQKAKEHNIKIIFVSPQFSQKSAKAISKNIKANIFEIDPLSQDWEQSMLDTANQIVNSYK
ncbi:metal ion ABC transporter, periplasmic metal-binding protein [Arcobacter venerupis]|uniref:Metal ion ABC transporter, periplasmic metal-binding protein n=1 Tax=Arcobacter venerupis TaxID=1054033 RepID=A0AAE7E4F6_9BACT|nr:zinc ABC transporter substrate-binding protein [Arcobacter venerupis]QKF67870.1 metal ion ABC transporter, periplasmic metal-binding protein [Arcobacter venerupis]RWS49474.1 cation ABC transporter substrate-binding protein [Arcobacter venerupis]